MSRNPTTNTQRARRVGELLQALAVAGVLFALAAAPAAARPRPNPRTQSATTSQAANAPAPTTVIKETVVKRTNSHPALPIALSAAALAVALAAAAYTLAHRPNHRGATRA
jgi:hypothetical protein